MRDASNVYKSQKLIRISLKYDENNNTIQSISITGDFFIHPEDAVERLERSLTGVKLDEESIMRTINKSLEGYEVFGFDSKSMTEAILGCLDNQ